MTAEKDTLRELAELTRKNGRTLRQTSRKDPEGRPIWVSFEYWGDDPAEGPAADLLKWEQGYIPRNRKRKESIS